MNWLGLPLAKGMISLKGIPSLENKGSDSFTGNTPGGPSLTMAQQGSDFLCPSMPRVCDIEYRCS